ncbi:MAG TPA: hypothetical protein VIG88_00790 [Lysobacter sp.]
MDLDALKALCAALAGASSTLFGPPANMPVSCAGGRKFACFKTSGP